MWKGNVANIGTRRRGLDKPKTDMFCVSQPQPWEAEPLRGCGRCTVDNATNGRRQEWNESQAIEILKHTGVVVRYATNNGQIPIPEAEKYHREIVAAHHRQCWDSYLKALQGWSRAACQASYQKSLFF